ncbi:unnamed protein product [Paramecium pentaurelia]|uniref:Protein kinase domain-containing protein n=1 Tax=Paramecium pentaurelia TaxID=43138 RepID=A0A8S1VSX5_9CILI|nr:unnamed protein product [Paramecium pentaurelia]
MYQQNQLKELSENTIIDAPTTQYPKRQFILEGRIGQGQLGPVYQATAVQWGVVQNKIALNFQKFIKDEVKQLYQQVIDYQNNENVNSQNFIRIFDWFDYQEYKVIVMEIVYTSLSTYLKNNQNTMAIQQKQLICLQLLQSITFLHSLDLVHRDIRLDHYYMSGLSVKLIDFGLTQKERYYLKYDKEEQLYYNIFQSPEFFLNRSEYTTATDVWQLACVFYFILNGTTLFQSTNSNDLKKLQQNQSFIQDQIEKLIISNEWKQTMKRMLHPQPSLRVSLQEVMEILTKKSSAMIITKFQQPNPNVVAQQQFPNTLKNQFPQSQTKQFNQEIQQIQVQQQQFSLVLQINQLISALNQPNNLNDLLQQKEQSIKLLVSLKETIFKIQNQLENNNNFVQPMNIIDINLEKQQKKQKEFSPFVQQKLDEIKKRFQEFEEKCISIQEEQVLNQKLQIINEELEILKNNIQKVDNTKENYQKIQKQVDQLKIKQQDMIKQKILEEELNYLQNLNLSPKKIEPLQKEFENNYLKIIKLEQQENTFKYLQNQILKQQITIEDLNQQISTQANLENEMNKQKEEILELKVKLKYLDLLKSEMQKNEKIIQQIGTEIKKLSQNPQKLEEQLKEIQDINIQLKQLQDMEVEIKTNKELINQIKTKLRSQNNVNKQAEYLRVEIANLEKELKQLEENQQNILNLSEQKKQLIEAKNQIQGQIQEQQEKEYNQK